MRLYGYFRSSAAYRVRIALGLKGIVCEQVAVDLARGDHRNDDYMAIHPQGVVPTLITDQGVVLTQSLAILEFLEERYPQVPLLPSEAVARARVRSLAYIVACDIHPLQNLGVRRHLSEVAGFDARAADDWNRHWIEQGLDVLEQRLAREVETGAYCHGEAPSLADVCLVPQLYNAHRYGSDLARYPTLARIQAACDTLPAFQAAHPHRQPDTPAGFREVG
jgi:maleylpyruvate isomerase